MNNTEQLYTENCLTLREVFTHDNNYISIIKCHHKLHNLLCEKIVTRMYRTHDKCVWMDAITSAASLVACHESEKKRFRKLIHFCSTHAVTWNFFLWRINVRILKMRAVVIGWEREHWAPEMRNINFMYILWFYRAKN
jgi:hypothetical protein